MILEGALLTLLPQPFVPDQTEELHYEYQHHEYSEHLEAQCLHFITSQQLTVMNLTSVRMNPLRFPNRISMSRATVTA